jgi:hypothetical protein
VPQRPILKAYGLLMSLSPLTNESVMAIALDLLEEKESQEEVEAVFAMLLRSKWLDCWYS